MFSCPIKFFTGLDCLGCGIQRSVLKLIQFNLLDSFLIYPPLIVGIVFCYIYLFINRGIQKLKLNYLVKANIAIVIINYLIKLIFHSVY
jgi:hypothetical protein